MRPRLGLASRRTRCSSARRRRSSSSSRSSSPTTRTPACRSCRPTSSRPSVPSAANLVIGNDVRDRRHAGRRRSTRSRRSSAATAAYVARLDLKLETTVEPLPVDSTVIVRPRSALGLKYVEITKGTRRRASRTARPIPLAGDARRRSRSTRSSTRSTSRRARPAQANIDEFGTALAGRGADLNRRSRSSTRCCSTSCRSCRTCRDPRTQPRRGSSRRSGATRARSSRRSAETQAAARSRNLDTTFARARQRRAAAAGRRSPAAPPALDAAIRSAPATSARSWPTPRACSPSCGPGVRALRTAAPALADALEIGTPALRRSVAAERAPRARVPLDPALRRGPARRRSASRDLTNTARILNPTLATLDARPDGLQLRDAVVPQRRRACSARAARTAPAALHHHRRAAGARTTRAARRRRPANGADDATTSCTRTRTRTPPRPASRSECEAGNETYVRRPPGDRQRAGQPGHAPRRHDAGHDEVRLLRRTRPDRRDRAAPAPRGASAFKVGLVVARRRSLRRHVLRLHEAHPVHARLPRQGGLRVGELDPAELAGADRGRERRQGHERSSAAGRRHGDRDDEIDDKGLPIHKDATAKIRPRIFLEGNFFVDLQPGDAGDADDRRRRHAPGQPDRRARSSSTRC